MKRGQAIVLFLCVPVLAVIFLSVVIREPVEPVYHGKKLSQWVAQYTVHRSVDEESESAIQAIGTNGLPCMLRWLPRTRDRWADRKSRWFALILKAPRPIAMRLIQLPAIRNWGPQREASTQAGNALTCFEILKKDASPTLPKLIQLAANGKSGTALPALMAMSCIGTDAVPALYAMVTNREYANRPGAAFALGEIRGARDRHEVIIALLACFSERDITLARCAADALGKLAVEPDLIVPALVEGLKNTNLTFTCARSLGRFGPAATRAVLPLKQALNEPNQTCRREILETLRDLDPEFVPEERRDDKPGE